MAEPRKNRPAIGRERVAKTLLETDGGEAFQRPLVFGDPEQVRIMRAINGPRPFCSQCYRVLDDGTKADIGRYCDRDGCDGYYLPGAAMPHARSILSRLA